MTLNQHTLFSSNDPSPVELVASQSLAKIVLACEHAGCAIPHTLSANAPNSHEMSRHIAIDIGAELVTRHMAKALDAPLVIQRYSRLVIDCNRPRTAADLCPKLADGTTIGFNKNLNETELGLRWLLIHQPFHQALAKALDHNDGAALATIHSFTPRLNENHRPWKIGFLARKDLHLARHMFDYFTSKWPDITTAINQPYKIETATDYTIPIHGEQQGRPHVLIEIRNDMLDNEQGVDVWADRLAEALNNYVSRN